MAVVDEEALRVRYLDGAGAGVGDARGVVGLVLGDGEGELAAGVDVAVEHVGDGIAGLLAGQTGPDLAALSAMCTSFAPCVYSQYQSLHKYGLD